MNTRKRTRANRTPEKAPKKSKLKKDKKAEKEDLPSNRKFLPLYCPNSFQNRQK